MSDELARRVSLLPEGTSVSRYITAKALGAGDQYRTLVVAERWRDTPQVAATLKLESKGAVPAGSTTDSTWASALAVHGISSEALTILRSKPSVLGQLAPQMPHVPLHVRVARETGSGVTGGWVAAGAPIPVQATSFATIIEEHYKYGVIVPLSEELMTLSVPDAESTITRTVLGGLAAAIDTQLLLPTVAAVANVNPASLTNGSTAITTTGTTSAAIAADLAGMLAAVTSPGPLVWVMRPGTLYRVALVLGSQAAGLPNHLFGIPVIASNNSPAQIALLDPGAMLYSDAGGFDLDVSREASYEFNTTPADPTTASTVLQSTWQRNVVSVRALRWLAWLNPSPTTTAAYMTVSY